MGKLYKEVKTPKGYAYVETDDLDGMTIDQVMKPKMIWDIELIPLSEHETIKDSIKEYDYLTLIKIHNRYNLSGYVICCDKNLIYEKFKELFND